MNGVESFCLCPGGGDGYCKRCDEERLATYALRMIRRTITEPNVTEFDKKQLLTYAFLLNKGTRMENNVTESAEIDRTRMENNVTESAEINRTRMENNVTKSAEIHRITDEMNRIKTLIKSAHGDSLKELNERLSLLEIQLDTILGPRRK